MENAIGWINPDIATLKLIQVHQTYIFPATSDKDVTITAGGTMNVYGAWTEITDGTVGLATVFAEKPGHIAGVEIESFNIADKVYMVQIGYGDAHTLVTSFRFLSGLVAGSLSAPNLIRVRSEHIPAGETIYYRCMCETADKVLTVSVRYFLHC